MSNYSLDNKKGMELGWLGRLQSLFVSQPANTKPPGVYPSYNILKSHTALLYFIHNVT